MTRASKLTVYGIALLMAAAAGACQRGAAATEGYALDLPLGLEGMEVHVPEDNPLTAAKVELGRHLYFDTRLSADNTVSCATCHNPRLGFADGAPVSTGIRGQKGGRSAPTTINRIFSTAQFWDGRAASLEEQAVGPIASPIEMGFTHEGVVERLRGIPEYRSRFHAAFGTESLTIEHIGKALASYQRTLISGNSPFDRYQAGDTEALSPAAGRGLIVFRERAQCQQCHAGPNFTDEQHHSVGIGMESPDPDLGRFEVTGLEKDRGAFKTPTLRDIALSAPYFHDGSATTLDEVVEYYDRGGTPHPNLSERIRPLGLSPQEKEDLVEFLRALTGEIPLTALVPVLPR